MTVVTIAPDWARKAMRPGRRRQMGEAGVEADAGHQQPDAIGPEQAHADAAAPPPAWPASAAPAAPPKPALITTAALQPRAPSSATIPGTVGAGVAITASSGTSGRLATSRMADLALDAGHGSD